MNNAHPKKNSIVLVTGKFNVLHPGHQRLLSFAKEVGNKLIVAVESDKISGKSAQLSFVNSFEEINQKSFNRR